MAIAIECPGCGSSGSVRPDLAGKEIRCKRCGQVFPVPAEALAQPPQRQASPEPYTLEPLPPPPSYQSPGRAQAGGVSPAPAPARADSGSGRRGGPHHQAAAGETEWYKYKGRAPDENWIDYFYRDWALLGAKSDPGRWLVLILPMVVFGPLALGHLLGGLIAWGLGELDETRKWAGRAVIVSAVVILLWVGVFVITGDWKRLIGDS